jgi:Skp family chaperone for outer membrane proteins
LQLGWTESPFRQLRRAPGAIIRTGRLPAVLDIRSGIAQNSGRPLRGKPCAGGRAAKEGVFLVSIDRAARARRRAVSAVVPALAVLAVAALVPPGLAQAQPAPVATYGPPTPGACLFAQAEALSQSHAGISADQQLKQFAEGADAELKAQRTAIFNDDHALAQQKSSLSAADYDQRVAQLRQRYAELDRTRSLRDAQLNLTRRDAAAQIMNILQPSLAETITARHCSFVLERSVTYGAADALDITAAVIQRMDARLSFVPLRLAPPEAVQPRPAQ